ncbi:PH domain-containing protein [Aquimarina sediminis]|uniref:PH domain-containing protein n=1 Tax=Aquimarina sediminis TaxID=2070536 RepID=UPI000CA04D78|nr:PH domain-containing protein [Aquimarina sediminis]
MENIKKYLNESQKSKEVEKVLGKVKELLTSDEVIEYIAVQKKPLITLSPSSIALTNKRIIFCRPKNFGVSMNFQDYLWKDIADCHMKEGIMGATFTIRLTNRGANRIDYIPKAQARKLYRYGQEREEEMSEYRRQRELENARAAAGGGIIVNTTSDQIRNSNNDNTEDSIESLKILKDLLESKLINQEEFNSKKAEILMKI